MRAVKNRGVRSTEMTLRGHLVRAGIRGWRMYVKRLPGTPDFAFEQQKIAVFVHGCFWHGCPRCYRRPHSSRGYWDGKLARNRARDNYVARKLRRVGWKVLQFWECDLSAKSRRAVIAKVERALHPRRG